jgi:hypothetical protein
MTRNVIESDRKAQISQSIMDRTSDVKQKKVQACFNTSFMICTEI